jgi:hypothetical protein
LWPVAIGALYFIVGAIADNDSEGDKNITENQAQSITRKPRFIIKSQKISEQYDETVYATKARQCQ